MYNKLIKVTPIAISGSELTKSLLGLPHWKLVDNMLTREVTFRDYETTWAFLTQVSMRSHLWGHHPTIKTTYKNVKLELFTHDSGNISDIDLKLAKRIEKYITVYIQD